MPASALGFRSATDLKHELEAERLGLPFVLYLDPDGHQHLVELDDAHAPTTIGRRDASDVALPWDGLVSRLHAQIEHVGADWVLVDDGLSRNGSFVNGERIVGRRALHDRDVVKIGGTVLMFRAPTIAETERTLLGEDHPTIEPISPAQKRVLVALCRPMLEAGGLGVPPTNHQIADELFLSVDAVKTHLRALFSKLHVEDLPQNQKRVALVQAAIMSGTLSELDLHQV